MNPPRSCIDTVRAWTSWSYRLSEPVTLDPRAEFRVILSKPDAELSLLDRSEPAVLTGLQALQPAPQTLQSGHSVFASDHFLLYHVAEEAGAACTMLVSAGVRPANILAVRALAH